MTELKYNRCGDYLISDMGLGDEDRIPLGRFGLMRCNYLKEHRPGLYTRLLLSGHLMQQLHEVDRSASQMMDVMLPQMAQKAGLTEALKNTDPLRWAGMMNTITVQIEEIILAELVYN
nr:TnpV protein [uncultured Oscillibacter sp.]